MSRPVIPRWFRHDKLDRGRSGRMIFRLIRDEEKRPILEIKVVKQGYIRRALFS